MKNQKLLALLLSSAALAGCCQKKHCSSSNDGVQAIQQAGQEQEAKIAQLEAEKRAIEAEKNQLLSQMGQLEDRQGSVESELIGVVKESPIFSIEEKQELERALEVARSRELELNSELEALKGKQQQWAADQLQLTELQTKYSQAKAEIETYVLSIRQKDEAIAQYKQALSQAEGSAAEYKRKLAEAETTAKAQQDALRLQISNLQAQVNTTGDAQTTILRQQLAAAQESLEQLRTASSAEISSLRDLKEQAENKATGLESDLATANSNYASEKARADALKIEAEALKVKVSAQSDEINQQKAALDVAKQNAELAQSQHQTALDAKMQQIEQLQAKLEVAGNGEVEDKAKIAELKQSLEALTAEKNALTTKINDAESTIADNKQKIAALELQAKAAEEKAVAQQKKILEITSALAESSEQNTQLKTRVNEVFDKLVSLRAEIKTLKDSAASVSGADGENFAKAVKALDDKRAEIDGSFDKFRSLTEDKNSGALESIKPSEYALLSGVDRDLAEAKAKLDAQKVNVAALKGLRSDLETGAQALIDLTNKIPQISGMESVINKIKQRIGAAQYLGKMTSNMTKALAAYEEVYAANLTAFAAMESARSTVVQDYVVADSGTSVQGLAIKRDLLSEKYDIRLGNGTIVPHQQFTKIAFVDEGAVEKSLSQLLSVDSLKLLTKKQLTQQVFGLLAQSTELIKEGTAWGERGRVKLSDVNTAYETAKSNGDSSFTVKWTDGKTDLVIGIKVYENALDAMMEKIQEVLDNYDLEFFLAPDAPSNELNKPGSKEDKLFSAAIRSTPEDITTKRGPLTSAAMRGSDTGSIDLRESFGQKFDLKLPLHVRVVGDTNLKETSNTLGSVFYKAGNSLFGVAQAYANQGNAFDVGGKQLETSAVSTFTLGNAFAEFQSGLVSADKVSGSNWSGSRQAMFLGYDMAGGISPFVQVSARQLSQENGVNHAESGAYVGTTVDRTKSNAFFNLTSLMTVKSGLVSDKASKGQHSLTASSFDHSVHMEQGFGSEGVSFNTSVGLSTKQNTNLKVAVGFSQ